MSHAKPIQDESNISFSTFAFSSTRFSLLPIMVTLQPEDNSPLDISKPKPVAPPAINALQLFKSK